MCFNNLQNMETFNKILNLLTWHEKKRSILLLILILCTAFVDVLGVASIMPFVALLTNPDIIFTNPILKYFYNTSNNFGITSTQEFMLVFGMGVFFLLLFSITVRAISQYAQIRFALMREYSIGKRLIENYLHQPYPWFLERNSADFGKTILNEVSQVIYEAILPFITVIAQSVLSFTIIIMLIFIDFQLAFFVTLVFCTSYLVIFYLMKNILSKIGANRIQANKDRFIVINEAFGSIKEVKVGLYEKNYIDRFSKPAEIFANCQSHSTLIAQLPRYFIEGIAFGGIILFILFLIAQGYLFSNIIPIISLYVFAGYRLLPSLQQIYNAISQLRVSKLILNRISKDLTNVESFAKIPSSILPMSVDKSIVLKNISFHYSGNKQAGVQNINLYIPALSKIGVVGITGSGKTTLIDIILGLLEPTEGTLEVDGNIISNDNKRSWKKNIGYVPQQIFLIDDSILANIAFGVNSKNIDYAAVEWAAKVANLHDFVINELPENYNTIVGDRGVRLSGGQRQRIAIARALYHKPKVLIFDEATSALDGLTEKKIIESMNILENKFTTILITHRLSSVKNCDIIFVLENGKLKEQGSYDELEKQNQIFKKML